MKTVLELKLPKGIRGVATLHIIKAKRGVVAVEVYVHGKRYMTSEYRTLLTPEWEGRVADWLIKGLPLAIREDISTQIENTFKGYLPHLNTE